jgi:hypothetical protein
MIARSDPIFHFAAKITTSGRNLQGGFRHGYVEGDLTDHRLFSASLAQTE